jgi:hypothetical protein
MQSDDLPMHYPDEAPAMSTAKPRPHRHRWVPYPLRGDDDAPDHWCGSCHRWRDPAASKRGKSSLRAGKDAERAIARAYGGKRTGQYGGPDDVVVGELFVIQSKAGKTWFRQGYVDELDRLPRAGGRIPTLVVSSRPGPGHPTRRYVVRLMEDDVALHGEDR